MKQTILFAFIFSTLFTQAGTQPQLAGLTYEGGVNGTGTIVKYLGGDTTTNYYSLAQGGCPGCGATPYSSLLMASDGRMYGLSYDDGANYAGTVFQYDYATNTYTVKASFNVTSTGYYPFGSLMQASNGTLYGLTTSGGTNGAGTLFSYVLGASTVTPLVSLPHDNGGTPSSLIQAADGNLYGTTSTGGTDSSGSIFQYNISTNTYTTVYSMSAGARPYSDLLQVGADTLYGTTQGDGTHHVGTIFRFITSSSGYTVLYNFDSLTGGQPLSALIHGSGSKLYGTASNFGAADNGTLYSFDLSTLTYTDLHNFNDTLGAAPQGSPYLASDGKLYGMTTFGGEAGDGVIYSYDISSATFAAPLSFNFTDGASPLYGHLIEYGSVSQPIVVTQQPSAQVVCAGSPVSFTISASHYDSIQWQSNSGSGYSNITGATDTAYSFTAGAAQSGYLYRVVLYGGAGNDTTAPVSLTVLSAATNTITTSVCAGQSFTIGTHTYTQTGTYTDTAGISINGCDSIVTLNLVVTTMSDSASVHGDSCTVTGNGATYQWYDCTTGAAISGAIFSEYTAGANGTYFCVVTLGSCTDTTNCVTVTGVGIHDISTYHFALYPNPTSGTFIIDNNYTGSLTVEVINILGEKMRTFTMNSAHAQFDISTLAAGMYEVHINDGGVMMKAFKLIKD